MPRPHPLHWLSDHASAGLRELPSNTAWLLSRALQPAESAGSAAETAAAGTRDKARKLGASVADVVPGGDSVEIRMKRARAAAERAREAEEEALAAAEESKRSSDEAGQVAKANKVRLAQLERELNRRVEQLVAEARRAADERVERERAAVRAEADQELEQQQQAAAAETQAAQHDAKAAQERAKALVAEASERLVEARELADEATQAARAAAEEAHRQAQALADDAEQQARAADEKVAAAEQVGHATEATAKDTARRLRSDQVNGDLESRSKPELLDLAAAIDIEGRTAMSKSELISAIEKASRGTR
jgi:colicin import membrane protein